MPETRKQAIMSGVSNAVDTVIVDRAMTRDEAYRLLKDFISDSLTSAGLSDDISAADMNYARMLFPI